MCSFFVSFVIRFYCSVCLDCCWPAMAWSMWRVTSERFEPVLSRKASESGFSRVLFGPGRVRAFCAACNILFSLFWHALSQTASGTCSDCVRCTLKLYQVHAQTVSGACSDCIRCTLRLYRVNTFHFQCTFHILNARVDPLFHILNAGVDPLKDL